MVWLDCVQYGQNGIMSEKESFQNCSACRIALPINTMLWMYSSVSLKTLEMWFVIPLRCASATSSVSLCVNWWLCVYRNNIELNNIAVDSIKVVAKQTNKNVKLQ